MKRTDVYRLMIIIAMTLVVDSATHRVYGTCPECEEPNPDYDASDPYESDPECNASPEGTAVPGEPCKECDGYAGQQNKPDSGTCCGGDTFDPATEGCCEDPVTGQSTKTTNPKNADMDQIAVDNGYCTSTKPGEIIYGATFCYNGKKVTAMCSVTKTYGADVQACVQAHEDIHTNDANARCSGCDTSGIAISDADRKASECAAFQAGWYCITAVSPSEPGYDEVYKASHDGVIQNCAP